LSAFVEESLEECASSSERLQSGQRLAKPGLPGLSSNSSPQLTQTLMGNFIAAPWWQQCFSMIANREPQRAAGRLRLVTGRRGRAVAGGAQVSGFRFQL